MCCFVDHYFPKLSFIDTDNNRFLLLWKFTCLVQVAILNKVFTTQVFKVCFVLLGFEKGLYLYCVNELHFIYKERVSLDIVLLV